MHTLTPFTINICPLTRHQYLLFRCYIQFFPTTSWNFATSHVYHVISHLSVRRPSQKYMRTCKHGLVNFKTPTSASWPWYLYTRAFHSLKFFTQCHTTLIVNTLIAKATFTPHIRENLGLSSTRLSLASVTDTCFILLHQHLVYASVINSSILSMCSNNPNTLWSTVPANSVSFPTLICIFSFLTMSISITSVMSVLYSTTALVQLLPTDTS